MLLCIQSIQPMDFRRAQPGKENDHRNLNKQGRRDKIIRKKPTMDEERNMKSRRNSLDIRGCSLSLIQKKNQLIPPRAVFANNTQHYCQVYGPELASLPYYSQQQMGVFLANHDIDKALRARMLDWMVEVIYSYKFEPKSYFASVAIMDRFFRAQKQRLPITQLHIIGVTAMLIATKMNEVFPLKIKTVFEKIVHKKISKKELSDMEAHMASALDFQLNCWDFYDLAMVRLHETYKGKTEEFLSSIEKLCEYVGKFVVFNIELYSNYNVQTLAAAVLKIAFRIHANRTSGDVSQTGEDLTSRECHVCAQLILDSIKNFKGSWKNLQNLYKFSDPVVMNEVESYAGRV